MSLFSDRATPTGASDRVEFTDERVRWRAREATFMAGSWNALCRRIPQFVVEDFKSGPNGPANPYIRTVVRLPVAVTEHPIPVGVVSNTYSLAQHVDVVERCLKGLQTVGIDPRELRCEVGLTPLGEWMNFRAYFPKEFSHNPPDGNALALRLECFNSVDGSSRLMILLGWYRFVCSNGLIIGETKAALRDVHDEHLDLDVIPQIVANGLTKVNADIKRLQRWSKRPVHLPEFDAWADDQLARKWGKKAACRTIHVCRTGDDVELADPFEGGKPSEKHVNVLGRVPGAAIPAANLYDVSQALSWIATQRNSADERLDWQSDVSRLIEDLGCQLETA